MSDPVTEHFMRENAALLAAWNNPDSATARARFDRIVDFAKSRAFFTEHEARNCTDHRLVLMAEAAMLKEQAEEEMRRMYRGELTPPPPPPTPLERAATFKNDADRADILAAALPSWGESTDRSNHDSVIAMLERKQGITR